MLPIHSVLTVSTFLFECRPFIQLFPFMTQMQDPICSISVKCEDFHRHKSSMHYALPYREYWLELGQAFKLSFLSFVYVGATSVQN